MNKISECCGATELYNTGLCSQCNEHTEFELMNKEGLVYIGDILDYGDGWVDMETAEMLLAENC